MTLVVAVASLPACGLAFVNSPRTAGLSCTQSKFLPYLDYLTAIGTTVAMLEYGTASDAPASLSVPIAFGLSGLWGSHKVNQCRERLAYATPEEIAQDARARAQRTAQEAERQRWIGDAFRSLAAELGTTKSGGETAVPSPPMSGTKTLTINGTTYTDSANGQLGQSCGLNNNSCSSPAYVCVLITSNEGLCAPNR